MYGIISDSDFTQAVEVCPRTVHIDVKLTAHNMAQMKQRLKCGKLTLNLLIVTKILSFEHSFIKNALLLWMPLKFKIMHFKGMVFAENVLVLNT